MTSRVNEQAWFFYMKGNGQLYTQLVNSGHVPASASYESADTSSYEDWGEYAYENFGWVEIHVPSSYDGDAFTAEATL